MKNIIYLIAFFSITTFFLSCKKDTTTTPTEYGTFKVFFDNKVGGVPMVLDTPGYQQYRYSLSNGQQFNFSQFEYYVSEIKLSGPNGESYSDKMSATATSSEGYYQVLQTKPESKTITLNNVPKGTYNKITFTIGINEAGVQSGASGGVLDPANGAWFWSWNSGYIGFGMEGTAANSPMVYTNYGGGFVAYAKTFEIHVGGWKDLPADSTGVQNFVNNVRTVTLNLTNAVNVSKTLAPEAHLTCDPTNVLNNGHEDFSQTYEVHVPKLGQPFANQINTAFSCDHVQQ